MPVLAPANSVLEAIFDFAMPIMPVGNYVVAVAVAEGTQSDHVIHQWLHDAVSIRSHSSSIATGLVGIPMENIDLSIVPNE
jgi:lipopolysaccharide transport system ATP-binding protein